MSGMGLTMKSKLKKDHKIMTKTRMMKINLKEKMFSLLIFIFIFFAKNKRCTNDTC